MVYVLNQNGQPLMPTSRCGKIKHLLRNKQAKVIKRCPFTVQLLYDTTNYTQPVTLGVDAGSKTIGLSVTTEKEELFAAEVKPRNDIVDLLSSRLQFRRSRRNRTTRYREPRFDNRVSSKNKGWLAPSVENKINTHIKVIVNITKILPITKVVVETAEFDLQRLKAMENGVPLPVGTDYQLGEMYDQYNTRQYVFFRDGYTCQYCHGKYQDKKLHAHHIESRKVGGNAPDNLITLCKTCHKLYHLGKIKLPDKIKRSKSYRDATFMGIMRKTLVNRLRKTLAIPVHETYGYITKYNREKYNIEKTHMADALCITGNCTAKPVNETFLIVPKRRHNRQIHKCTILKGGVRKLNQSPKYVKGFQLFDKVKNQNEECFIFGRRASGSFDVRKLNGTKISAGVSYKKLVLLERRTTLLVERSARVTT